MRLRTAIWSGAVLLAAGFSGCMKSGDGIGLDEHGHAMALDPCLKNPDLPGCKPDTSCAANPGKPGCRVNPCATLPKPEACLDTAYFTANVLPIFKQRCEACHNIRGGIGYTATGLTLEAAAAWDSLVNSPSRQFIYLMRVRPGLPDSSYMFWKIAKTQPGVGVRMPMSQPPLSTAQIEIIRTWIAGKDSL